MNRYEGVTHRGLDAHDVVSPFSPFLLLHFELNIISLHQRATESRVLYVALVEKNILSVLRRDEAEALRGIVELHDTLVHNPLYPFWLSREDTKFQSAMKTDVGPMIELTSYFLNVCCL